MRSGQMIENFRLNIDYFRHKVRIGRAGVTAERATSMATNLLSLTTMGAVVIAGKVNA